jgi:hypothetical protein
MRILPVEVTSGAAVAAVAALPIMQGDTAKLHLILSGLFSIIVMETVAA